MDIIIKPMETEDEFRGKAYVHWKSWQKSYAGIVDADYLASRTLADCEKRARKWPSNTWVAKDGERVVGFTVPCVIQDENGAATDEGEVRALYVLEEFQHRGIGYALMRRALGELKGCRVVYLWLFAENKKALSFYERVGFRLDGTEKELVMGTPVKGVRMTMEL